MACCNGTEPGCAVRTAGQPEACYLARDHSLGWPLVAGCTALSFGVHCARLAGLDPGVLQRAKQVPWRAQHLAASMCTLGRQRTLVLMPATCPSAHAVCLLTRLNSIACNELTMRLPSTQD